MITYHEVKGLIQKTAALSSYVIQMNELLPQVIHLSERLHSLNEDLALEQDRMMAKMKSVEVLDELLRAHIYHSPADSTAADPPRHA